MTQGDPKDTPAGNGGGSFLRKVARFVANPTTEWSEIAQGKPSPERESELFDRAELKAMIERKRRNDFVRKREFDMLRRMRREGLTPEQLAALGSSSKLDNSEARLGDSLARPDSGVRAKIAQIEREMVGDQSTSHGGMPAGAAGGRAGAAFFNPASRAGGLPSSPALRHARGIAPSTGGPAEPPARAGALPGLAPNPASRFGGPTTAPPSRLPTLPTPAAAPVARAPLQPPPPPAPRAELPPLEFDAAGSAITARQGGRSPTPGMSPLAAPGAASTSAPKAAASRAALEVDVQVSEITHDPELDEAVIAFAGADFELCERSLRNLTAPNGSRLQHPDTWLVLFDLYRAIGHQQHFEVLAMDFAQQFGSSSPQWFSLPQLVAEAAADERVASGGGTRADVGWAAPVTLDLDGVQRLRSLTMTLPLPWVFDFSQLQRVEPEAATQLSALFRQWAGQALDMQWAGGEKLFSVLAEQAPTGMRDADPAFWLARLDGLRLIGRPDQFDEAAIDYCVTYEVSPPAYEPARCKVRVRSSAMDTSRVPSVVPEISSSFVESMLMEDPSGIPTAHVELAGQLVGDIGKILSNLDHQLGDAKIVQISCARLIRVDFVAAGDLLNWVLAKATEHRHLEFQDAHRLVALFFGAMGITEHARVQVRRI